MLVILDGFGVNPGRLNNGIAEAKTPRLDEYYARYPHTVLDASGRSVGLPDGQMGNSEVGHLTIGSGAILRQYLVRIDDAIADGSFFVNDALMGAAHAARNARRPLHLIGMVSDGGVHSHLEHLLALVELCRRHQVRPLVHMITDGRDTPPRSALAWLPALEEALAAAGGAVAVVSGRYWSMDRDKRWDRTEKGFLAHVHGGGLHADSAREAIDQAYARDEGDEFIQPTVLPEHVPMLPGDQLVFFNFRNDRTRQITAALTQTAFEHFDRGQFTPVTVTCMTEYDPKFAQPVAFGPEQVRMTLGEYVSNAGLRQFRCAETEKYAHVTFFLNGGREQPYLGEDRVMLPSPKVATYDLAPEMSAAAVADAVVEAVASGEYGLIVVNFANGDMVGHTAVRPAIIKAVECLDREVGRVLDAAVKHGVATLVTADHGNCEEMVDAATQSPHTQHTTYPVPCLVVDKVAWKLATGGGLSNVAPTILELMGLEKPAAMTGRSLLLGQAKEPEPYKG